MSVWDRTADLIDPPPSPFVAAYYHDPAAFADECVAWPTGSAPTAYQADVWRLVTRQRRLAIRAPHGTGKTATAAILILWFALTRDMARVEWKIPTTASAWYQLTHYLWPEIRKWAGVLRWDVIGRRPFRRHVDMLERSLKLDYGEAFAVASNEPARIEGAHADELLYVFDEAKAIEADTFEAAEGAFAGAGADTQANAYALAQSTPGDPAGVFYDICRRRAGYEDWHAIHITLEEAVEAGRISGEWADQRRRQWGETSAIFQNRVLGEFAASEEDSVIPLTWVEAAQDRWRDEHPACSPEVHTADCPDATITWLGVDVARKGGDQTVIAHRSGDVLHRLERYGRQDTMETAGRIRAALGGDATARIELDGVGAGPYDRLREQGAPVAAFVAGSRTDRTDRSGQLGFVNRRAAAWWGMRERLEPPSSVALPPADELTGDLTAPKYKLTSGGKIQVEAKEDIVRRLGRSPDVGDATVIAFDEDDGGLEDLTGVSPSGVRKDEGWMPS